MKTKANWTALIVGVAALSLSGCAPDPREVTAQSYEVLATDGQSNAMSGEIAAAPVLDEAQIRKIVAGVQDVLDSAQESGDPAVLSERLTGSALAMRTAEMVRAQKTGKELAPLEIEINVASATVAQSFPRTLLVGSSASADDPAEVFLFTQADAKSDYMLENWVRVVGGNSIHGVAIDEGSQTLTADDEGGIMSPDEAVQMYASFLKDPDNADLQVFVDDTFSPKQREEITQLRTAVEQVGTIGFDAWPSDYPVTGVTLASGQGLFAASLKTSTTYQRTVADSKMAVGGTAASYLDNADVIGTVTVNYLVNFFFLLPPQDSQESIRIVGVERAIESVSRDDAAKPEGEE